MRYKNTKTGVVIDSTSKIIGKAWIPIQDAYHNQKGEEIPGDEEVPTKNVVSEENPKDEEYVEEEVDLAQMTNKELEEFAKDNNVKLTADDKKNKETRINAIAKAFD